MYQNHTSKNRNSPDDLVKVIKSGESYDISSVGEHSKRDLSEFVGTWSGQGSWYEHFGYTSEIETSLDANGDLFVTGIAFQWMEGWLYSQISLCIPGIPG